VLSLTRDRVASSASDVAMGWLLHRVAADADLGGDPVEVVHFVGRQCQLGGGGALGDKAGSPGAGIGLGEGADVVRGRLVGVAVALAEARKRAVESSFDYFIIRRVVSDKGPTVP